MLRSRFLRKLYLGHSAIILIAALVVGGVICHRIKHDSLAQVERSLEARATLLQHSAYQYLDGIDAEFQQRVVQMGQAIGTRLTVIDAEGVVVADSQEPPAQMDNHFARPELLDARTRGRGRADRYSDTLGIMMMYLALPIEQDGQVVGYVRASMSLAEIQHQIRYFQKVVAMWVGLVAVISLGMGFVLARRFVGPLMAMTGMSHAA